MRRWLADGHEVRVFTARVADPEHHVAARKAIAEWTLEYLGRALEATCAKDYGMVELWDDRAVQVEMNTGRALGHSAWNL